MSFQSIVTQNKVKTILQNGLRNQRVSHAYIFSGPQGTGKRKMALALAQSLLCVNGKEDACGQCVECRKFEHGNHPYFCLVEPSGTSIKIDQIRELQRVFAYRDDSQQKMIYLIEQAEKMTTQAANSLLKFLEEPKPGVTGILLTENGHALLPTLRSRSQWIPFVPEPPRVIEAQLVQEGISQPLARLAARLRSGTEGARSLVTSDSFAEMRNVVIQLGKQCVISPQSGIVTAQRLIFRGELSSHIEMLLDMWTLLMKDMVYIQCGRQHELVFMDQADWITKAARNKPINHWVRCVDEAVETRKRLRLHVQPQLALERLLLQT